MRAMARSVLNNMSTVEIVAIFVLGSVALAVGVSIAIRRLFPDIGKGEFEDLASGLRVVYELLFALILAFVIASVLDKFNQAQDTVGRESTALAQMVRSDAAFPTRIQERLDDGIYVYIEAVTHDEWESMKHGARSPEASAALETLYGLYAGYEPHGAAAGEFYGKALDHLDEVATARRERVSLSAAKLPTMLVIMLPIGAILLLILEYRPKLAPRSQAAFMGTLALVLSSTYLLTIVLDYPFSGDVSVDTSPLRSGVLAQFADTTPRAPQPGDRKLPLTAKDLDGVWYSDAYGTLLLRAEGRRVRGAYRIGKGTVNGTFRNGVFRGVWCQSTRKPKDHNAGLVEWRRVRTKDDTIVTGVWGYGYKRLRNGDVKPAGDWGLSKLKRDKADDLKRRLDTDPPSRYCRAR
jgi:hypothetical protein